MVKITGELYRKMLIGGAVSIENIKEIANDLNVFPVPDGDTGTNMALTMSSALKAMSDISEPTLKDAVSKTATALLRGARGNSGVILSLLFRGIAKHLKELDEATGIDFAKALVSGVETAYSAVMKPAEGTILTVSRVSAKKALDMCNENPEMSVEEVFVIVLEMADIALKETQFQNSVLEKAGVVDAGAYGYIEILKGMQAAFLGKEIEYTAPTKTENVENNENFAGIKPEDIVFAYCTEFIAQKEDARRSVSKLSSVLEKIGDSIVVVDDEEIVKVHVHTNEPNIALAEGLKFGQLLSIKIENMREQHSTKVVKEAETYTLKAEIAPNDNKYGFVSVSAGEGLNDIFKDLGVEGILYGGQTMNPSTGDIVHIINSVPAENVFVFPNNKNIIMAAEQAKAICDTKNVIVIPTKTIQQGISALLNYDESMELDDLTEVFNSAISRVTSGQITYAARNSEFDGKKIKEGEYLSLLESKLNASHKKIEHVCEKLAKDMVKEDSQFVTVIYGQDSNEELANSVAEIFAKMNPDLEVTIINGGQPVYYFFISVE